MDSKPVRWPGKQASTGLVWVRKELAAGSKSESFGGKEAHRDPVLEGGKKKRMSTPAPRNAGRQRERKATDYKKKTL